MGKPQNGDNPQKDQAMMRRLELLVPGSLPPPEMVEDLEIEVNYQ